MPLTHQRTFRVRRYECDIYGQMHPANYLRYMQEAAIDASAAAGYDDARYQEMQRQWFVRDTRIEYHRPLRDGDLVGLRTWVADFQRVRSRRAYTFHLASSDEAVAEAITDWVFLDSTSGRPAAIPPELAADFYPEGLPASFPPRSRYPPTPPPPPHVFRHRRQVEWQDLDVAEHVNNAVYLAYIEDCAVQAIAACGWPHARMQAEGFVLRPRVHWIEYQQPAILHDELELTTWVSSVTDHAGLRHFVVRRPNDASAVVRARTSWECADLATGETLGVPARLRSDLAATTVDEALRRAGNPSGE